MRFRVYLCENLYLQPLLSHCFLDEVSVPQLCHNFIRNQDGVLSSELLGLFPDLSNRVKPEENAVRRMNPGGPEKKFTH